MSESWTCPSFPLPLGTSSRYCSARGLRRRAAPREETDMSLAADVVDAQVEAYRARDVEQFLCHYADDASVITFDGTAMFADKQAMREQYGKLFADSPD